MSRVWSFLIGAGLILALDALVIVGARLVDPGAPVMFVSNLAAVFIGVLQLVYGLPIFFVTRPRRPAFAAGLGVAMGAVLVVNVIALFR